MKDKGGKDTRSASMLAVRGFEALRIRFWEQTQGFASIETVMELIRLLNFAS